MSNNTQGVVLNLKSGMAFNVLGLSFKSNTDYTSLVKKKKKDIKNYISQVLFWMCSDCNGTDFL